MMGLKKMQENGTEGLLVRAYPLEWAEEISQRMVKVVRTMDGALLLDADPACAGIDLMEILLRSQSDITLVAQVGSLVEARAHTARFEFDVAVLDLGFTDGNGVDLIADLRQANPEVGVLSLSASLDATNVERAADADEIMDKLAPWMRFSTR